MTEEHKKKISIALLGKNTWSKGKKLSEETKRKIGNTHRGMKRPEETGEKISQIKKGKKRPPFSEKWKRNMSRGLGKNNPLWKGGYENHLWHNRRRYFLKKGIQGFHSLGEWETLKAQYNWICPLCKKVEPEIRLTVDHIIPISKGGSDNIENIQPLCRNCNSYKGNRNQNKYD